MDINARNEAVVTLQENNWLAIVHLPSAKVRRDFSAGSVTLHDVDATEESAGPQGNGIIDPSETITRRREPDGVAWIDDDTFATANEGDYEDAAGEEGGSRSFTLFGSDGTVEYESGASLEHEVIRHGHYPEARSENKGVEPEGVEVGVFGGRTLLFVAAERANVVAVYDVTSGAPQFVQLLPTGIGPEGLKAVPGRDLLAVTSEEDDPAAVRSLVTLWRFGAGPARYPYLVSAPAAGGVPIPWVAMSGLAGDPDDADTLWAVSDSFLAQAYAYRVDVSSSPAQIAQRIPVGGLEIGDPANPTGGFDFEGVAARPEGGFWFASEGRVNVGSSRPNALVRTNDSGAILTTVLLPAGLAANATSSGFEGVAVRGTQAAGNETVYVAVQGRWSASGDPANRTKIGRYDVATGQWTFALYPLEVGARRDGRAVGDHAAARRPHRGNRRARQPDRPEGAAQADLRHRPRRRRLEAVWQHAAGRLHEGAAQRRTPGARRAQHLRARQARGRGDHRRGARVPRHGQRRHRRQLRRDAVLLARLAGRCLRRLIWAHHDRHNNSATSGRPHAISIPPRPTQARIQPVPVHEHDMLGAALGGRGRRHQASRQR